MTSYSGRQGSASNRDRGEDCDGDVNIYAKENLVRLMLICRQSMHPDN